MDLSFFEGRTITREESKGRKSEMAKARDMEMERGLAGVNIVAPEGEWVVV